MDRVTVPLGPLVSLAVLQVRLGAGTPEGDFMFWDCGCALRLDGGEGAWRYAVACTDHNTEAP